jgi:SPP1 gp7 family putative phage head morphogenesis protein
MPLLRGKSPEVIQENIKRLLKEGKTKEQAVAIALELARNDSKRTSGRSDSLPAFPSAIEERYYRNINKLLRATHEALVSEIKEILSESRFDSAIRVDAGFSERILGKIEAAKNTFLSLIAPKLFDSMFKDVNAFVLNNVNKQFNIETVATFQSAEEKVMAEEWVALNTDLISRAIKEKYFDGIEDVVITSFREGLSINEIQSKLLGAYDLHDNAKSAKARARLIARDQIGKLSSNLTQFRHRQLGINQYQWSTSGDERVRPSHARLDGRIFSYDNPPDTGRGRNNPGEDYQCLLPWTIVQGSFKAGIASNYDGDIARIKTGMGAMVSLTARHPVLTRRGFIPAKDLIPGEALLHFLPQEASEVVTAQKLFSFITMMGNERFIDLKPGDLHGEAEYAEPLALRVFGMCNVLPERSNFDFAAIQSRRESEKLVDVSRLDVFAKRLLRAGAIDVVETVDIEHYSGPVYDFQTVSGLMVADNIVVSNCRCVAHPILPGDDPYELMDEAHQRQTNEAKRMNREPPVHPSDKDADFIPEAMPYAPR